MKEKLKITFNAVIYEIFMGMGKHNVEQYLRNNTSPLTNNEFTIESLSDEISYRFWKDDAGTYSNETIRKHLDDLVTDGFLKIRYESHNNKTVSVYKIII